MPIIILHIIHFLFLVFSQIFIINNLSFGNADYLISPIIYISFLYTLPYSYSKYLILIIGFFLGLIIDIFLNTYGLHASACLLICYIRPVFVKQLHEQNKFEDKIALNIYTVDRILYIKYISILSLIFFFWLFLLEEFNLRYIFIILIKTILSTIASVSLILIGQFLLLKKTKHD